ncbi:MULTISPECIES: glycosyltransferase [unclassified Halomonas]|uniref:glycosyltransferase n=1 Tax=unclassified Halomonas TaxID=2609666 RepID=UPI0007DA057C|nr:MULTISPECIES: glycosyltransferase [unclassified Halomonas]MBT2785466.1 glycosyltransferase [Halomonas sp. ISL-106]MBT2797850.1 glycosyltransferase [Halomonas sp. ISL-104]OAL59314.1 glycosyl transferase family 1 [Halomonas sp. ALS9]
MPRRSFLRFSRQRWLRLFFYLNLALVVGLIAHQVWLYVAEPKFESVHTLEVANIREVLTGRSDYRFAVVGNINNSVSVFQEEIVPLINQGGIDFLISAGNAVNGGQQESYQAIYRSLEKLNVPYLLTYGDNEDSDFGSYLFYEYFGPHFYSFVAGNSHFIFLDGTGKSSTSWQLDWLSRELAASEAQHKFLFVGLPLHNVVSDAPLFEADNYLNDPRLADGIMALAEEYGVDTVFSANLTLFSQQTVNGVDYVTTGGAGGILIDADSSFHHYVIVDVASDNVAIAPVRLNVDSPGWWRMVTSVWSTLYAFFYVSYTRFLLIVGVLTLLTLRLHRLIFEDRDYYPDFDIDPTPFLGKSLRVAMVSNNYFPFVSGVSVSVDRLRNGLRALGHSLQLFVPRYREAWQDDSSIKRIPTLMAFGQKGEFRLTNPFSARFRRCLRAFKPDLIHVHHPFWLGSMGLFMGRRLKVPVIYTYHTRLEHYAHFVPLPGALFRNLISHYLIKRFSNRCQGVIVPTYSAEEYLRMIGVKTPTLVQPTGIDVERFSQVDESELDALREQLGVSASRKILISVSRISKEKNIGFILESLAELRSQGHEDFHLLLIGDGPDREAIQTQIDTLKLTSQATLVGAVPPERMAHYYHLGDLFVFASTSETQGMVILEAMSAGLPVVAVRSSGIDDVVRQGVNGFKTPQNRQAWGQKVVELKDSAALRQQLGKQASHFAEEFDIANFASAVANFYAEVLAKYHSPSR